MSWIVVTRANGANRRGTRKGETPVGSWTMSSANRRATTATATGPKVIIAGSRRVPGSRTTGSSRSKPAMVSANGLISTTSTVGWAARRARTSSIAYRPMPVTGWSSPYATTPTRSLRRLPRSHISGLVGRFGHPVEDLDTPVVVNPVVVADVGQDRAEANGPVDYRVAEQEVADVRWLGPCDPVRDGRIIRAVR